MNLNTPFFPVLHRASKLFLLFASVASGQSAAPMPLPAEASCGTPGDFFRDEVWTKVAALSCLECHKAGGEAEESRLILLDPARESGVSPADLLQHNRAAFVKMAGSRKDGQSRLLLKASGGLSHEGEEVLKPGSTGYRILEEFVARASSASEDRMDSDDVAGDERPFFEGVDLLDDRQLLRRATLSLGARLPTPDELEAVAEGGLDALGRLLDPLLAEEAFYQRLAEAFNDILLVRGYGDGAESALSYEHFSETRHWPQKHDLSHIEDEKERERAGYRVSGDYREALLREPLELIKHIVRNDRPFTEIVTADYIMVSPYTSRGYGIDDEVRASFSDPENPFEYVPVRLKALRGRDDKVQESETGFYPHAGMISIFQYLRRYPTTETNRNRLRARMYYQHFLGVDVLELAARVSDAAAVTAKYEVPTMQASECAVCHRTLDPVAGLFQDYYSFEGVFGPRKEGWYEDMFGAGFEGGMLPPEERWRALQWLGERTVRDPRFATTMVEHVWYVLTGRKAIQPPKEIDDPMFGSKQRAYQAQRDEITRIASRLVEGNFNLKIAFKEWIVSQFYRADALAAAADPGRMQELADVGVVRMLGPEQIERKVAAIFGKGWGRLDEPEFALLYGGIDSEEVTERAEHPSGAMGAIHRTLANDIACRNVADDFSKEPAARRLFPAIEPDDVPGVSPETDQRIREAIVHLHLLVCGRQDAVGSPEVDLSFELFSGIVSEAAGREGIEARESYFCRDGAENRPPDPNYTIRAWRGVLTYLLRQREFLYE
jgi:hypothetical protein